MALTSLDVRRIAELARLDLGADEQARMLDQLNSFFRIVEQMRGQLDARQLARGERAAEVGDAERVRCPSAHSITLGTR